jgi:hypothetical protein
LDRDHPGGLMNLAVSVRSYCQRVGVPTCPPESSTPTLKACVICTMSAISCVKRPEQLSNGPWSELAGSAKTYPVGGRPPEPTPQRVAVLVRPVGEAVAHSVDESDSWSGQEVEEC